MSRSSRFCPSCGEPLEDGARFCGECGAEVTGASQHRPRLWWGVSLAGVVAVAVTAGVLLGGGPSPAPEETQEHDSTEAFEEPSDPPSDEPQEHDSPATSETTTPDITPPPANRDSTVWENVSDVFAETTGSYLMFVDFDGLADAGIEARYVLQRVGDPATSGVYPPHPWVRYLQVRRDINTVPLIGFELADITSAAWPLLGSLPGFYSLQDPGATADRLRASVLWEEHPPGSGMFNPTNDTTTDLLGTDTSQDETAQRLAEDTISEPIAVTDRGVRFGEVYESGVPPPGVEDLYDLLNRIGAVQGLILREHYSLGGTPTQPLTEGEYQAFAYAPGSDGLVMHVVVAYPSPEEAEANVAAAQSNVEDAEDLQGFAETDGRFLLLRLTHPEGPADTNRMLLSMIHRLGVPGSLSSVAAPPDS